MKRLSVEGRAVPSSVSLQGHGHEPDSLIQPDGTHFRPHAHRLGCYPDERNLTLRGAL